MPHKVYESIVKAVGSRRLQEPFSRQISIMLVRGLGKGHIMPFWTNIQQGIREETLNCFNVPHQECSGAYGLLNTAFRT